MLTTNSSTIFPSSSSNLLAWPEAEALAFWFWSHLSVANLRTAFYLVTPAETTFQRVEDVPDYTIQVSAWWALLFLLELAILCLSGHSSRFALSDSISSISAGILSQFVKSSGRTFCLVGYVWIWDNWRLVQLDSVGAGGQSSSSPLLWAFCLLSQDFAYYLGHRAMHEVNFLWAFHSVHHSSQFLNLSTALRQPIFQDIGLAPYELVQAFFVPPPVFLAHRYFSHIYQFWLHTSLLGSLGPLGLLFNTPSFHRVHHGRNPYCIDRNFGALLIIWDRIFGTFQRERADEPPQFGLAAANDGQQEGSTTFDQLQMQWIPLKNAFFGMNGTDLVEKMKALYWPPGWHPGMATRQFFHWRSLVRQSAIDEDDANKKKLLRLLPPLPFTSPAPPPLPLLLKAYLLFHFLFLLLPMFVHFQYSRANLGWTEFAAKMLFFFASLSSFGLFFDQNDFADLLELSRCIGFCLFQLHQIGRPFPLQFPSILLLSIFSLSAAFCLLRALKRVKWNFGKSKFKKGGGSGGDGIRRIWDLIKREKT